jgi:hypothetical protein
MADIKAAFNTPFKEAIDFFGNKIKLPTSGYTDIWREQHSHAFVVAGAANDALVEDFYNALHHAMTKGTGLVAFQKSFDEIVAKHGWSYNGSAGWRSKLIYQTNITQAYNAGQYQQMMSVIDLRPYWQYAHISIINPRVEHQHLDGLIIAADDPFWDYYMPQNGYGCQCRVYSLSRPEARRAWEAQGKTGADTAPEIVWEEKVVGKNGSNPRTVRTPKGIDPSFAYNPGKAWLEPLTVPRLTGYDAVLAERKIPAFPAGTVLPPLPKATVVKPSILLPVGTDPAVAVESFLNVFDANLEKGVVFEDAAGVPVAVTKRLFADETGSFAGLNAAQIEAMDLLAMTLAEPDEIWHHWEADKDNPDSLPDVQKRWRLKRRYLRVFEMDGEQTLGISAFEWSHQGWVSSTAFMNEGAADTMDSLRVGNLVYSKDKP